MFSDPTNGLYDPLPPHIKHYFHDVSSSNLRIQMVAAEGDVYVAIPLMIPNNCT